MSQTRCELAPRWSSREFTANCLKVFLKLNKQRQSACDYISPVSSLVCLCVSGALQLCRTLPRRPLRAAPRPVRLAAVHARQGVCAQRAGLHVQLLAGRLGRKVRTHARTHSDTHAPFIFQSLETRSLVCRILMRWRCPL